MVGSSSQTRRKATYYDELAPVRQKPPTRVYGGRLVREAIRKRRSIRRFVSIKFTDFMQIPLEYS
jgi:hypothetical protein